MLHYFNRWYNCNYRWKIEVVPEVVHEQEIREPEETGTKCKAVSSSVLLSTAVLSEISAPIGFRVS